MGKKWKIANKNRIVERFILPLIMMIGLIACGPINTPINTPQTVKKHVALIVFVQSDLNKNNDSDYSTFQSIRDKDITEAIDKNIKECPDIDLMEIYPLYANTHEAREFGTVEISTSDIDYDKKAKIKHFLIDSENQYGQFLDDSTGNKFQDIVGAYYFLKNHQDTYSKYDEIRVVFISDMIHYRASINDYDINTDYITFRSFDCLEAFKKQVNEGKIKTNNGSNDLQKLFNGKKFVVWTVKPDLDGPRSNDEETRGFDIDGLWREFFTKIGATEVKMNM